MSHSIAFQCGPLQKLRTGTTRCCHAVQQRQGLSLRAPVRHHTHRRSTLPSLGSCKGLVKRNEPLRPVVPRQGRLMCQAAKQAQVTGTFECQYTQHAPQLGAQHLRCTRCASAESIQASQGNGWGPESTSRLARSSVLWSCIAFGHSCWCLWLLGWSARSRSAATCVTADYKTSLHQHCMHVWVQLHASYSMCLIVASTLSGATSFAVCAAHSMHACIQSAQCGPPVSCQTCVQLVDL